MPSVTLTDDQVVELVRQLPAQQKRAVLLVLAEAAQARRDERMTHAEAQLRRRAAERGLNWDALTEDAREAFIDDLLHEAP
jgi:TRAP-type C4-dicarboxylate transport system substrate-binding protein